MVDRRKTTDELNAELAEQLQNDDEAAAREGGDENNAVGTRPSSDPSDSDGDVAGTFEPITEGQREEINELFALINSNGYLTAGMYDIKGDGNGDAAVTLTVMLPSSADLPGQDG